MDRLSSLAVENAAALARNLGVSVTSPVVLKDGANVMVHLAPAPVVARVATTTALVRPEREQWLARELAVARFLVEQGAPVVEPSGEVDPGPHTYDGYSISFWHYVEQDRNAVVSAREAAPLLRELHAALAGYTGDLPYLGPVIDEIPRWLKYLQANRALPAMDMTMLREGQWRLAERLSKPRARSWALHGDAHIRNLLATERGLIWTDFEDACRGPLAWDVACLVYDSHRGGDDSGYKAALAAYGGAPGLAWDELEPYLDARELESVVWSQVQALRFPERRRKADALLEAWRNRIG